MRLLSHWTESYEAGESDDILRDLALAHCEAAGPYADEIAQAIKACKFRQICDYELDYSVEGVSPYQFYHARQALAFFSKLDYLEIGVDKEGAAVAKFQQAEQLCRETNGIFKARARGAFCFTPRVESWLFKASRQIARVLGPLPQWDDLGYRFGKGATTLTKKRLASLRNKFAAGVSCSEEMVEPAKAVLSSLPKLCEAWASAYARDRSVDPSGDVISEEWYSVPVVVHHGKLEFVPKNAKTHRSTVTEPVLNGLVQLALGDYIAERLAAFGQSTRDQTRNQRLAREGSLTGALATLDLSSASDTLATELVFDLLPLDWASRLNQCRTRKVLYRNEVIVQEKFSSMGNGFTFALETLIFWSLASAVCEAGEIVSVYGDDIILPSSRFKDLVELLTAVGFIPNEKKSFATGPFRESCGCDYISGIDIRPYYQRKLVSPETLFTLHNYYVRHDQPEMARRVRGFIHPSLQIFGPDGYGDGHLLGDWPKHRKDRFARNGYEGYLFDTFTVRGRKDIRPKVEDFVLPSYSVYLRERGTGDLGRSNQCAGASVLASLNWSNKSVEAFAFKQRFMRGHGPVVDGLPISEGVDDASGDVVKHLDLPLPDEERPYKRVSIYTLR